MQRILTSLAAVALFAATAFAVQAQQRRDYSEPYPYHKSSGAKGYQVYPVSGCEDFKAVGGTTRQICNQRYDTRDARQFYDFRDAQGAGTPQ